MVPLATSMTYRSVRISVPSVIQANSMCLVLSLLTCVHIQYRTGCLEKCLSRPPVTCRQEWQESVYTHSRTTLVTKITLPKPNPKPPVFSEWKATMAS